MALLRRPFLWLQMTLVWMILSDDYTLSSFVMGLLVAAVVLALFPAPVIPLGRIDLRAAGGFLRWAVKLLQMLSYFLWELVLANWQVTKLALRRKIELQPGILRMDLKARSNGQIALLSAMITLTPGTIVMDLAEAGDAIYIHTIDASDPEGALLAPRRFEAMILEVIP